MGIFSGCCIALELSSSVTFKKKQEIRRLITENDGTVSFIVNKKCRILVTNESVQRVDDSYKCRTAQKHNIPVVSVAFLYDCVANGKLLDPEPFFLLGKSKSQLFKNGVIQAAAVRPKVTKSGSQLNWNAVKAWGEKNTNAPSFPVEFDIAKSVVLKKRSTHDVCVVELHVSSVQQKLADVKDEFYEYRIMTHAVDTSSKPLSMGKRECRYARTATEAVAIYARVCRMFSEHPYSFVRASRPFPAFIGSAKFQLMQLSTVDTTGATVDENVLDLVNYIWKEATGQLDHLLTVPASTISVHQVEKAMAILLEARQLLDVNGSADVESRVLELSDELYKCVPHSNEFSVPLKTKRVIANKQQLCQLVSDMISVSESAGWSDASSAMSKYRALRCHVHHLAKSEDEYITVEKTLRTEPDMQILNIFRISRPVEDFDFQSDIGNVQLMCHSSCVHNFVGILSRGLLLPRVVVDDLGGSRTDAGMLGHGIYFADSARTSARYSKPSQSKGSRLMALCDVALGQCYETCCHDTSLLSPPSGYDSVHGVGQSANRPLEFAADEYAVYRTDRQRIRYLVEFVMPGDRQLPVQLPAIPDARELTDNDSLEEIPTEVSLSDVQNVKNPLDNIKAGLVSSGESNAVPLKSVHIRARLVDLAAQVVVLQEYFNESDSTVEAKYVFPLDEFAVVCGFEAFINGKHVVGVVKEKETAHREYKQAVSEGHGAYLMDQDKESPDVFTVSVGNLPPRCNAVIKITYVAELPVDGELISFRLPASVAPWTQQTALNVTTQDVTQSVKVIDCMDISVHVAIEMPFDIRKISSATHRLQIKKTATKAVVRMAKNQSIGDGGFQLSVLLAELHVPRMWVEQHPVNPDSRACMVAFYPEFEESSCSDGCLESVNSFEVIFVIDLSNSMRGLPFDDALKVVLLAINHLPSGCLFNIITYGTDYDELFPSSQLKNTANLLLATAYIKSLKANMGNSDLYRPLHAYHLLDRRHSLNNAGDDRSQLNMFVVSDGHWTNRLSLSSAVQGHAQNVRVFTFGVSDTANRHALRSLARAGAGAFEFFDRKAKSKWEARVRSQLMKASQPSLSSIEVVWQQFNEREKTQRLQAPANIMALFNGCRQVVYGFVPNCTQATLKAVINNQQVSTVVSTSDLSITTGKILHQLTARAAIQDWENGLLNADSLEHQIAKKNSKNNIIKLSIDYSIVSEFTSFIAIEKRDKDEVVDVSHAEDVIKLIEDDSVDILNYIGWEPEDEVILKDPEEHVDEIVDDNVTHLVDDVTYLDDDDTYDGVVACCYDKDQNLQDENSMSSTSVGEHIQEFTYRQLKEASDEYYPEIDDHLEPCFSLEDQADDIMISVDSASYEPQICANKSVIAEKLEPGNEFALTPQNFISTGASNFVQRTGLKMVDTDLLPRGLFGGFVGDQLESSAPVRKFAMPSVEIDRATTFPATRFMRRLPEDGARLDAAATSSSVDMETAAIVTTSGELQEEFHTQRAPAFFRPATTEVCRLIKQTTSNDETLSREKMYETGGFGAQLASFSKSGFGMPETGVATNRFGSAAASVSMPVFAKLSSTKAVDPAASFGFGSAAASSFGMGFALPSAGMENSGSLFGSGVPHTPVSMPAFAESSSAKAVDPAAPFGFGSSAFSAPVPKFESVEMNRATDIPATRFMGRLLEDDARLDAAAKSSSSKDSVVMETAAIVTGFGELVADGGGGTAAPPRRKTLSVHTNDTGVLANFFNSNLSKKMPLGELQEERAPACFGSTTQAFDSLPLVSGNLVSYEKNSFSDEKGVSDKAHVASSLSPGTKPAPDASKLSDSLQNEFVDHSPGSTWSTQFSAVVVDARSVGRREFKPSLRTSLKKILARPAPARNASDCLTSAPPPPPVLCDALPAAPPQSLPVDSYVDDDDYIQPSQPPEVHQCPYQRLPMAPIRTSITKAVTSSRKPLFSEILAPKPSVQNIPMVSELRIVPPPPRRTPLRCSEQRAKRVQLSSMRHSNNASEAKERLSLHVDKAILEALRARMHWVIDAEEDVGTKAYWELGEPALTAVGVDYNVWHDALCQAGLMSLGEIAATDICRLLATLAVLFHLLNWTSGTFVESSMTSVLRSVTTACDDESDQLLLWLASAARYVIAMDLRRPMVYWTLRLGRSWIDVIISFLSLQQCVQDVQGTVQNSLRISCV